MINLKYLKEAVDEFKKAIEVGAHIVIQGDYDLDGLCCLTLLITFLDSIGYKNYTVIHYTKRTHSIDHKVLSTARFKQAGLIILCDTGCSEIEHLVMLNSLAPVIVLDHHLGNIKEEDLTNKRITIVNPAMWEDPYKMSAACVVYEMLKRYVYIYKNDNYDYYIRLMSFYPLLSIYADGIYGKHNYCYNLYQESRNCLVPPEFSYAKQRFNGTKRYLLFTVAPPINAAFRNGRLDLINKLFLDPVPLPSYKRADLFEELALLRTTMRGHIEVLSEMVEVKKVGNFVIADLTGTLNQGIPNEIIWNNKGLIANKLASKYKAACVCVVNTGSYYSVSVRDYLGRNVLDLMSLFYEVGGHPSAFGGTMTYKQVVELADNLALLSPHLTEGIERTVKPFYQLSLNTIEKIAEANEFCQPSELFLVAVPKDLTTLHLTPSSWGEQYYQYHLTIGDKTVYIKRETFDDPNDRQLLVHFYKGSRLSGEMIETA